MRIFFWLLLIFLVFVRYTTTRPNFSDGQKVRITDRVTSEPLRFKDSQRVVLAGLRAYLPAFPEVHYGDRLVIEGVVDGNKLSKASLVSIRENQGVLLRLRKRLIEVFQKSLPEPHSALVAGIALGFKAGLPSYFWEALKKTGTAHVVVASGMNVTIVAAFLMGILILFLPRGQAIPAALAGIWLYSLISGFDAPIVRAAIMGSLAFTAQALGRLYLAGRALILSALIMLIVWPDWLTDLGFILSFVATASLILFEVKIRNLIHFIPGIFREGLSTSLAAQIGVAPIIFVTFGQFSLFSPIVNAFVLWTIGPITVIGGVGALIGLVLPLLGKLVLLLVYPLTSWFVLTVNFFA